MNKKISLAILLLTAITLVIPLGALADTSAGVEIVNFAFNPANITIAKGTTVIWTNNGSVQHTVTSDVGLFDSGFLNPGQTFNHTFNDTGTFDYHCSIHTFMHGTVIVTETAATPTAIVTETPVTTATVTSTVTATPNITATPNETATPNATATPNVTATVTPTETSTVTATVNATVTGIPTATATPRVTGTPAGPTTVPEFPTVILPVAAVMGLIMLLLYMRRDK